MNIYTLSGVKGDIVSYPPIKNYLFVNAFSTYSPLNPVIFTNSFHMSLFFILHGYLPSTKQEESTSKLPMCKTALNRAQTLFY